MGFLGFSRKPKSPEQAAGPSVPKPKSSNEDFGLSIVVPLDKAQVDIVFVHGLTGHREGTWTAGGQDEPWFKSLLPKDLPTARIMTYGYDANVANFIGVAGQNTVREHARNLVNELAARRRNAAGRPIIFVAHSLGGLVCQDALLICINPDEEAQSDILSSTCGIAFLGTPHAGSDLEKFAVALANIVSLSLKKPNKKLLKVLGRKSEVLANIKNDFMTMVHRHLENIQDNLKPIRLHAFIEELPVDYLGCRVVEPDSAKIPGYNSETIHANHMEMTKFNSKDDPGYVKVLDRLKVWTGYDDALIALLYDDDLRRKFETLWPGVELAKSEPPASAKQLCESSSIEASLKWFTDSSEYRSWKAGTLKKLWLHGKHSDGKTVIMSYVARSLSQDNIHSDEHYLVSTNPRYYSCPYQNFSRVAGVRPKISLLFDGIDKLDVHVRSTFLEKFYNIEIEAGDLNMRVLMSSETNVKIRDALTDYSAIDREKLRSECLKTLEFQEWNAREIGVQEVEAAGRRFFGHEKYINWIECDGSAMLWLEGKPGSGKSTLAKFMVKKLEKNPSLAQGRRVNLSQDTAPSHSSRQKGEEEWVFNSPTDKSSIIARFYYSFRGGNTQTSHELMLRSIVYQIWRENSKLFPLIRDRYLDLKREMNKTGEQKPLWSYDDLKLALESLREVNFNLSVFIIIDGMDESNNDKRVDILQFLLSLTHASPTGSCIIKVFVASRPENNINSRLRRVRNHIKLQEVNQEDIRMVVESWIKRMVSEGECEEATLLEVKNHIITYSDGVFMLRSLPKELGGKDGFYRTMVNSLVENYKEDQEYQELGRRIFIWVTFAERPISITELQDALATPTRLDKTDLSTYILEDNRPHQLERAILSYCGGLVEIRRVRFDRIVQLIHQTAREFLLHRDKLAGPYHLDEVQGDLEIAMSCCRYLSIVFRPEFPPAEPNKELPRVEMLSDHLSGKALLAYALVNFQGHLDHLGSSNEKVRDEFMKFVNLLINRSGSYASLLLGQWIQALKWPTELRVDETSARLYLHFLVLCVSDEVLLRVLLPLRSDLLHIVAGQARQDTTQRSITDVRSVNVSLQVLMAAGADVNREDMAGRTPLSYAVKNGHEDSVRLLIEKGANLNLKDADGQTLVLYAAKNGLEGSLNYLLMHEARPNTEDTAGRTPMSYAAENGHEGSLKLLFKYGARVNTKDTAGRSPLSYALSNKHMAIVKLLESYAKKEQRQKEY
ncbi:hypothetical protein O988_04393 [Pseudogymnoascus sp. VKM F-3808]|nr:hypothetical protein O988_04393 [Pseudogymnoascus sp. VKM F-3808]